MNIHQERLKQLFDNNNINKISIKYNGNWIQLYYDKTNIEIDEYNNILGIELITNDFKDNYIEIDIQSLSYDREFNSLNSKTFSIEFL